jgi:predicted RNase H-like HicB family nuclease
MKEFIFHGIIQKEEDRYTAICLELDVATEGDSLEEAKKNLKEAVEGYIESVVEEGEEAEFIPRPVPQDIIEEYLQKFKEHLLSHQPSELYEYRDVAYAQGKSLQQRR